MEQSVGATGAQPPVDDLGLVGREAVIVGRGERVECLGRGSTGDLAYAIAHSRGERLDLEVVTVRASAPLAWTMCSGMRSRLKWASCTRLLNRHVPFPAVVLSLGCRRN